MRREFARFIVEHAERDADIVLMVGDIGFGLFDEFRERFPLRFFNFGICEQSMISAASGMSQQGLKPYVNTITPYLKERPFEQVKLDIDQQNVNVVLVGFADYPSQGLTHSELDGPYLMKIFKNIESFFPQNSKETREVLVKSYHYIGPSFVSLKRDLNR